MAEEKHGRQAGAEPCRALLGVSSLRYTHLRATPSQGTQIVALSENSVPESSTFRFLLSGLRIL